MNQTDIAALTAHDAARLLADGEVSSVELTAAALDRIARVDPAVGAFITVTEDLAMRQAADADARIAAGSAGPLAGVPMALKDNIATRGVRTTCASRILEDFTPPYDAAVAARLRAECAPLVGKANLDEFAMGSSNENSAFHPTRNPWALDRAPGGSSGGPAAAVAAGECVYALGSDTGGSVRQPAALCGVVGMKPTYGLVSRFGLVAFASSLDQIGPLTKDVADCALALNAIAGNDPNDSTSLRFAPPDYTRTLGEGIKGMRIGVPAEYFAAGLDAGVDAVVRRGIETLASLGAVVEETSLPSTPHALAVYYIIAPSEASANLARYDGVKYGFSAQDADGVWDALEQTRQRGFGPEVKRRVMLGAYALSAGYYDAYYLQAQRVRTLIRREFDRVFADFDAVVTPTSPTVAFKLGEKTADPLQMYLNDILTIPANIAGVPAISLPAGLSDGLPVGMQLMGPALSEPTLLRAAYAFEQAAAFRETHGGLALALE